MTALVNEKNQSFTKNTTVRLDVFKRDTFFSRRFFTPDPISRESARQVRADACQDSKCLVNALY
jgi:hypothetical protein